MIKKKIIKKNSDNKLLNLLFQSKCFYGEKKNKTNASNLPYIYGTRQNYSIIDLKYTLQNIKKVLLLIKNFILNNKKILIVNNDKSTSFLLNKTILSKDNIYILNKDWTHGLLTNDKINFLLKEEGIDLIIFIKPNKNFSDLLKETYNLKIPVVGVIDTSMDTSNITYPILVNCKNLSSIYLITYLIRKTIINSK